MTSNRRRKQQAQAKGLTDAELQLTELLEQVLDLLRWNQVLGYSNQYLLHDKLGVDEDERSRVMKAAAGAVEADGRVQDWGRRLREIQSSLRAVHERMTGERLAPASPASPDAPGPRLDADAAETAGG